MSKKLNKKYNAVARAESDVSQTFVRGAAILTLSMVIVKIFGLLDKVILSSVFSSISYTVELANGTMTQDFTSFGLGLYSNAYEIFVVIFTVATGGLPIAISRLVSESTAQKRYKDVKLIHKISVPFFIVVGVASFLILVGASFIYVNIIKSPYSIYAMLCLAPTVLFGCLVSIYRGYFEGQRNMAPTAISEIIEACVKLFIGALLAYVIAAAGMNSYAENGTVFGMAFGNIKDAYQTIVAFSVAGAIMGITLGSCASFLFVFIRYKVLGDGIPEEYYKNSIDARSKRETFIRICKTAIPTALGALVMSLGSLIDQIIIQRVLLNMIETNPEALQAQYSWYFPPVMFKGHATTIHTNLWGCYSAALTFMQLVTAVTQVFGSSAMPNVTSAWTKGNKDELKRSIETVIRMTMLFTLPMALGLSVLASPVMEMVFFDELITRTGGNILMLMGITTIFTAASTPVCSMLQGIGRVDLPMKLYTVCMLIKIGVTWMFVSIPSVNIQGATAGSLIAYAVILIIGMYLLIKHSKIMPNLYGTVIKPLIGAVASAAAAWGVYRLMDSVISFGDDGRRFEVICSVAVSVAAAIVVYVIVLLILRAFTATELKFLPKGEKIAKALEKFGLIE